MSVNVRIPTVLRPRFAGKAVVEAEGTTLSEVMDGLEHNYPGSRAELVDENGEIKRFVNVFVGDEDVRYLDGLDTPVPADGEVVILPAVAGGSV
ncbi:MAG: MoaD/ThiS family protein [Acidimicrobiia bacterium]|nr:MoaD/ThiS family protein [Acidimicrobiia bacterium]